MPYVNVMRAPAVYHIGHLDKTPQDRRPTLDGPCIAVSRHPESWRRIKGLNGPEHKLEYGPAQWVDVMSFEPCDREDLKEWMLMRSYMEPVKVWIAEIYNEDRMDFETHTFDDFAAAARAVGRTAEQELEAAQSGQGALMEDDGYRVTRRGMARIAGMTNWPDPFAWLDAAVLLYTREVVLEKRPFVVGLWWDIPLDPDRGMAPYGLLFPERAHLFEVEDEEGNVLEFRDCFTDFPDPG
jgi:hypothetical protein